MAVIITKEIKKRRIMSGLALSLIVIAFLIVYFGMFYKPKVSGVSSPQITPASGAAASVGGDKVPDLNVDVFNDERFKVLVNPPGVPIATDTPGKINPFSE